MIKEKELVLLSHFRNNSRISLTSLSKMTHIPVSTIFDKLKYYEKNELIKKHTTILDFRKLGYELKIQILITAKRDNRDELQKFLISYSRVNTIYRINNGYDFLIEAYFKNMQELDEFMQKLDLYEPAEKKEFFVMEDIKREEFLTNKKNIGVLN
ncbi:hypothetical protein COV13_00410 [Candidatus Woesearchaeota archaeon CG10_big_fil_rev_8_21_14_0_10_32_9]|nr:MAG: hypothetical protein COV13_00410 [Candidatus Woesearchaeota archaeon CG10_big_fil_rev_8_21_14_0_10_32_9]